MFEIKKCARCGEVPDGHAWIDDRRYCHGDDIDVTCFMIEQFNYSAALTDYLEGLE